MPGDPIYLLFHTCTKQAYIMGDYRGCFKTLEEAQSFQWDEEEKESRKDPVAIIARVDSHGVSQFFWKRPRLRSDVEIKMMGKWNGWEVQLPENVKEVWLDFLRGEASE